MMHRNAQLHRLLALLRDLASSPEGLILHELAERHSVTRRTLERDLQALAAAGLELISSRDPDTGYVRKHLHGAKALSELPLTARELASAYAAHTALSSVAATPITASFAVLLRRLEQAQPAKVRVDAIALGGSQGVVLRAARQPEANAAILGVLQNAILACSELRVTYRKGGGEDVRDYLVQPCGLLFGGRNYLVWRGEDGKLRKLTLAFIEAAEPTGRSFEMPDDFNINDFSEQTLGVMSGTVMDVVLRLPSASVAMLNDFTFHPSQQLDEDRNGVVRLRFQAAGTDEICNAIFACGAPVTVEAPATLQIAYRERLHAALWMQEQERN